jgi:hypothetical protein
MSKIAYYKREDIVIENQFASDVSSPPKARNHSQQVLTDALATYRIGRGSEVKLAAVWLPPLLAYSAISFLGARWCAQPNILGFLATPFLGDRPFLPYFT